MKRAGAGLFHLRMLVISSGRRLDLLEQVPADPCSVAYGLNSGDFDLLSPAARKKLVRLMSRISEASYRRGFQHGTLGQHTIDPHKLRYEGSIDQSPLTDRPRAVLSAEDRLFAEYGELYEVGFFPADECTDAQGRG